MLLLVRVDLVAFSICFNSPKATKNTKPFSSKTCLNPSKKENNQVGCKLLWVQVALGMALYSRLPLVQVALGVSCHSHLLCNLALAILLGWVSWFHQDKANCQVNT